MPALYKKEDAIASGNHFLQGKGRGFKILFQLGNGRWDQVAGADDKLSGPLIREMDRGSALSGKEFGEALLEVCIAKVEAGGKLCYQNSARQPLHQNVQRNTALPSGVHYAELTL
ncbi:MAG: hypothetical protein EB059_01905 [Alphaproteobacteria bacterium]|nr:hypothetical protein [Alphaproteobacteria bacterium]